MATELYLLIHFSIFLALSAPLIVNGNNCTLNFCGVFRDFIFKG